MCDTLIAIHHDPWFLANVRPNAAGTKWDGVWQEKLLPALHPSCAHIRRTGRNGLFVNHHRQLLGLSDNESNAILEMLYHHCVEPTPAAFRWQAGSVTFWDNRPTLHYALDDYGDAAVRPW